MRDNCESEAVMEIGHRELLSMKRASMAEMPREACGLIVRPPGLPLMFVRSNNVGIGLMEYSIDPEVQLGYHEYTVGVFHSHVERDACMSGMDIKLGRMNLVYVIYSVVDDQFRGWKVVEAGEREAAEVRIVPV